LVFLYLPSYGRSYFEPRELETYRKMGPVLIPPRALFEDQNNWHDKDHFNTAAANKLSEWIAKQLTQITQN
jgi:hypothetical protein